MDFRSMLKKKKYAKWGNDDEGLYKWHLFLICLDLIDVHKLSLNFKFPKKEMF